MLKFLSDILANFRKCFSRSATYRCFVALIIGFMIRRNTRGVTSIIDALSFQEKHYDNLLHCFRSEAYQVKDIRDTWTEVVKKEVGHRLYRVEDRAVLVGDGTKQAKEGRRQPGVDQQYQESMDNSKATYIWGHLLGCIGTVVLDNSGRHFCTPLSLSIQGGLHPMASWDDECSEYASSHVVQTIQNAYAAAEKIGPSYCALDRYFLSVPALKKLEELNQKEHILDVVTRARGNCVAYTDPPVLAPGETKQGRPRMKGDSVKLFELFQSRTDEFEETRVLIDGKLEDREYMCLDLLWGQTWYHKLRFVLVKSTGKGDMVLVSTDLNLSPERIIEIYALRHSIEDMFKVLKTQMGGTLYHFWTKFQPYLDRWDVLRKKKELKEKEEAAKKRKKKAKSKKSKSKKAKGKKPAEPKPPKEEKPSYSLLTDVTSPDSRQHIMDAVTAMQRFVQFACISLGLAQMMTLQPKFCTIIRNAEYKRTNMKGQVSAGSVLEYLSWNLFRLMFSHPGDPISRIIASMQRTDLDENWDSSNAA